MKIKSEDLDIIKVLEEDEPGKWLENRDPKYLKLSEGKISLRNLDKALIEEDPELMLRILRLSGELIMDIDDTTLNIIKEESGRLSKIPRNRRRDHFVGIITSNDAQKALGYVRDADMLVYLFGDATYRTASRRTLEDVNMVIDNINKARPEIEYRLTLLIRPFGKEGAVHILNHLIWDHEQGSKMIKAIKHIDKLYFQQTKLELKKYIKKLGHDDYTFVDKVARQEKKIYDRSDYKVEGRHYLLEEILYNNEPFKVEHLEINADDLINNGIAKDEEHANELLDQVLDFVITQPKLNKKDRLLKKAKQIKTNPFVKYTRKVWWRR